MKINISYLNVPLFDEESYCQSNFNKHSSKLTKKEFEIFKNEIKKNNEIKLKDSMFMTAKPLYKNKEIEFEQLHRMVSSDNRQYSPFSFSDGIKKSENWNNENQNILILDIDDGLSIKEAMNKFKHYKYFICTTKSHQKEKKGIVCDRFRIIFPTINNPIGDIYFEYMRNLESMFSFIDKQVNTKTGAFLGSTKCSYFYNEGDLFDMDIFKPIKRMEIVKQNDFKTPISYENDLPIEDIKNRLTRECVADIVQSLGYEVNAKFMFKYRENENTPSASIKQGLNPLLKDFGSDLECDAIGFVQQVKQCDFKTAVEYVGSFVNVSNS